MPLAKPCFGYPSRTAAVLGMRELGMSQRAIAAKIGIPVETVSALECSGRRKFGRSERQFEMSVSTFSALLAPAKKRGITVRELARQILEKITADKIADAVMDDGANDG